MIIDYVQKNSVTFTNGIYLRWRDKDGHRMEKHVPLSEFSPYFFVDHDAEEPAHIEKGHLNIPLTYEYGSWVNLSGKRLKKVIVPVPHDIQYAQRLWQHTYEADVPFGNRYAVDHIKQIPEFEMRIWLH